MANAHQEGASLWTISQRVPLACAVAILVLMTVTSLRDCADTSVYAADVAASLRGIDKGFHPLWEFGHVLWCPIGMLMWWLTHPVSAQFFPDHLFLQVFSGFVAWNHLAAIGCFLLLYAITCKCGLRGINAAIVLVVLVCTNAVLSFMQSGTAYVPGFTLQLLAIYLLLEAAEQPQPSLAFSSETWAYSTPGIRPLHTLDD